MTQSREQLLHAHAALPEAYQPAWGLSESQPQARRPCEDRFAVALAAIAAFPSDRPLRILDIGCAQGYFSLGLESELRQRGRAVQVVGVDSLAENVDFCTKLAAHHGLGARFFHDRFDPGFFGRHALADFDIVLALNVLHHIRESEGADGAEAALETIRSHSSALLCELAQADEALDWVADWHASDEALLHGYAFRRRLGTFATHLTQVRRPLYACSNRFAYLSARWFGFDRVLDRAHPGVPDHFSGQRRFFIGRDAIVKAFRGDGDFGTFNRAELLAEAEALTGLCDEPERYPQLLAQADEGDTVWLARGLLRGKPVSELIDEGVDFDRDALLRALLGELAHLQERGYHHGDLRAWNMLWHEGTLRLIDFGSMTRQASPLHRVALAAVLAEIARGELSHAQPWYTALHPMEAYPAAWHALIRHLLGCEQRNFRYGEALALLDRAGVVDGSVRRASGSNFSSEVLAAAVQAQIEGFQRLQEHSSEMERSFRRAHSHAADLERDLHRVSAEADAERAASSKVLSEASTYAASLKVQLERQTADATAERAAAQAALADAARHAKSLEMDRTRLREKLERMRQRFHLLRPLWPREDKDQS